MAHRKAELEYLLSRILMINKIKSRMLHRMKRYTGKPIGFRFALTDIINLNRFRYNLNLKNLMMERMVKAKAKQVFMMFLNKSDAYFTFNQKMDELEVIMNKMTIKLRNLKIMSMGKVEILSNGWDKML